MDLPSLIEIPRLGAALALYLFEESFGRKPAIRDSELRGNWSGNARGKRRAVLLRQLIAPIEECFDGPKVFVAEQPRVGLKHSRLLYSPLFKIRYANNITERRGLGGALFYDNGPGHEISHTL